MDGALDLKKPRCRRFDLFEALRFDIAEAVLQSARCYGMEKGRVRGRREGGVPPLSTLKCLACELHICKGIQWVIGAVAVGGREDGPTRGSAFKPPAALSPSRLLHERRANILMHEEPTRQLGLANRWRSQ